MAGFSGGLPRLNVMKQFTASNMDKSVAVVGGGPAGLMAAEVISAAGIKVDVYDAMRSVGRKFFDGRQKWVEHHARRSI